MDWDEGFGFDCLQHLQKLISAHVPRGVELVVPQVEVSQPVVHYCVLDAVLAEVLAHTVDEVASRFRPDVY